MLPSSYEICLDWLQNPRFVLDNVPHSEIRATIDRLLTTVGVCASESGRRCLVEAIFVALETLEPPTSALYRRLAKRLSMRPMSIERSIRAAVDAAYLARPERFFGAMPSVLHFIADVAHFVRSEHESIVFGF